MPSTYVNVIKKGTAFHILGKENRSYGIQHVCLAPDCFEADVYMSSTNPNAKDSEKFLVARLKDQALTTVNFRFSDDVYVFSSSSIVIRGRYLPEIGPFAFKEIKLEKTPPTMSVPKRKADSLPETPAKKSKSETTSTASPPKEEKKVVKEDKPKRQVLRMGVSREILRAGRDGKTASKGQKVKVRYEGRLAKNGKRFDKGAIDFKLGAGQVIAGWDIGIQGMKLGEVSRLLIPSKAGYGARGAPPSIPPNNDLIFEVELLKC